jgi:Spy/CpxP family protein refolding chaperone
MKRTVMACALILGGLLTLPLRAANRGPEGWGHGGGRGHGFGGHMFGFLHNERMKAELGLTDEQAGKLRQIFTESRKAGIRTRADLQIKRMELHEIMMGDKADRDAAMKKVQEISDLRAQQMRSHVESMLAAKTILTPEQQKKIHAMMAERMSHRGEGFQGRRGMGRRPGGFGGPGGGGPGGPPREFAPEPDGD